MLDKAKVVKNHSFHHLLSLLVIIVKMACIVNIDRLTIKG